MFDPSDFLDLAREFGRIMKQGSGQLWVEPYYASFLAIRNAMAIEEKSPEVHRKVVSMLYKKNAVILNKLHYLRRQRNNADYDTKLVMGADDADKAVKVAGEITLWRG